LPELFPQIDAWAVPVHKVIDLQGRFRSKDLKDYLALPTDRKLILTTCAPDNYQEILWKKAHCLNCRQHNIDYWFPGHFSIYDDDAKLYHYVSAKRQLLHAVWTHSQFIWFRLGENIPIEFFKDTKGVPSILISTQQMYSKRNCLILAEEVQIADKWFSAETMFFIVGSRRKIPPLKGRAYFEINSNWMMKALKGHNLSRKPEPTLSIKEMLIKNLEESLQ